VSLWPVEPPWTICAVTNASVGTGGSDWGGEGGCIAGALLVPVFELASSINITEGETNFRVKM